MAGVALYVGLGLVIGAGVYAATRARPNLPGIDLDEMQQTAKEGEPRIQVWGTVRPIRGNVVAAENPPRVIRRKQSGGKGGSTPRTEHPYRTYAIGVCEGPIGEFRRIWRNNKLVYDARPGSEWGSGEKVVGIDSDYRPMVSTNNDTFLEKVTLYLGDYEQMPDPSLEQIFGAGQVPAMRGTAYIVIKDEDLTDMNGAVPQWTFEVRTGDPAEEAFLESGTFTAPEGTTSVDVLIVGGGGSAAAGSGGGGGGQVRLESGVSVAPGENVDVIVAESSGSVSIPIAGSSFFGTIEAIGGGNSPDPGLSPPGNDGASGSGGPTSGSGYLSRPGGAGLTGAAGGAGGGVGISTSRAGGGGGGAGQRGGDHLASTPSQVGYGGEGLDMSAFAGTAYGDNGWFGGGGAGCTSGGSSLPSDVPGGRGGGGAYISGNEFGTVGMPNTGGGGGGRESGFSFTDGGSGFVLVKWDANQGVGSVLTDISVQAGIPESRIDTSMLDGLDIVGVPLSPAKAAADTISSICEILQIDVVNVGGVLRFKPRGGSSVVDISGADAVDDGSPIQESKRKDRIEIPKQLILEYYDVDGGLNPDTQLSTRALDSRAISEIKTKTSVIMTAVQAAKRTQIAHKVFIEEQNGEWEFSLPDSYLWLTIGDIVKFEGYRLRITQTEIEEGFQNYTAVHDRASAYLSNVTPKPPGETTPPPSLIVGQTVLYFIDSHILRDADDRLGYYVAISGAGDAWQGALVELSTDGGETYPDSLEVGTDVISGFLIEELPAHNRHYPDTVNTLSVQLLRDDMELESATLKQMMNRQNLAIIGDELINFGDAEEDSQGSWELSNIIRGRKGSPISSHPADTRFVLLERQQLWFLDAELSELGEEITFRVTSLGSQNSQVSTFTFTGESQAERQPAYLTAERDGGDVVITWQGVGRIGGGVHVAMGSYFQHYRVTVNGTDYTTTDQNISVADPGGALEIEVRQVNSLTGAGPAATVNI